ncbi:unnamed protein product [Gadus morhua 'NCC']
MVSSALLSSLLLLWLSGILAQTTGQLSFLLEVKYNQPDRNSHVFSAQTPFRGVLFGAMTRLNNSSPDFNFTSSTNVDYGEFLVSVNGLFGNDQDRTYWELLVQKDTNTIIRPDVGISCYIPQAKEKVILNYTTY